MSDHDREVLRFFCGPSKMQSPTRRSRRLPSTELASSLYQARDVLLQRLKDDNPTHASGDCPTVRAMTSSPLRCAGITGAIQRRHTLRSQTWQ